MSTFKSSLKITYIGTATAILEIDGVKLITDPVFSLAGSEWDKGIAVLKTSISPALQLQDLPPLDAVLLSHEDHEDNLDELGRRLLDGRKVLTTMDGASKLAPRPGVRGLKPWETTDLDVAGKRFKVTATPCDHLPGGECIGFVLTSADFGETNGLPNAIYISGDTVYMEELARLKEKFHISVALLNLGAASVPVSDPPLVITMDGKQASRLIRDIEPDIVVPLHFEGWTHFAQGREEAAEALRQEGIEKKVMWLPRGVATDIV
ncbi:zn-dependent hydrolases of the beta-lactamase protein [Purpureocillium lavendulum]|uniref:Zn-dependent hydrolases of the beta-lactamase protein n=1 Tax=Purpureocillium lavendulum TaxID=1247861 RepID=A0AB34FKI4_9HYPO|nr:zn-dependent hydrolases of the beta-lactamase protein [Purpureocillium lavendulum]